MKLNRTLLYILAMLPALLLQSCLKNQEDIFDAPSSIRMQEMLDNTKRYLPVRKKDGYSTIIRTVISRMEVLSIP